MLQFKQQEETDELSPRWNIGVDRRHVVAYVAIALIAGSVGGFLVGAYFTKREQPVLTPATDARASAALNPNSTPAIEFHRVTKILRGDAIEVDGVGPVRMLGIETPDGKSPRDIYGAHGERALAFVEKMLLNQDVRLEFDNASGAPAKDDSGQVLAYVYTRDGTLINGEMVRQGLAFVSTAEHRLANDFRGYERDAMQGMRGVWGSSSSSSSTLAITPSGAGVSPTAPDDKPKKLQPLPPSALGLNIPALAGSPNTPAEQTVWVSSGDKMYHKSTCDFLDKKKRSIPLSQAKSEGYTACSRCYASTVLKAP